jgi:hypothetical protein
MSALSLKKTEQGIEIHTEFGPVGPRLERGAPLPKYRSSYPDSPEGRAEASADMAEIDKYIEKHKERKIKHLRRK